MTAELKPAPQPIQNLAPSRLSVWQAKHFMGRPSSTQTKLWKLKDRFRHQPYRIRKSLILANGVSRTMVFESMRRKTVPIGLPSGYTVTCPSLTS